ncbi:MAG TPA: dihydrofolate reductase, partial [Gallionella sp.]|nr:dihydrofolate reductase [Gallionella sp.]
MMANSLQSAIAACNNDPEIFVIGGAELYLQAIALADRIYLTEIDADIHGDAHFPEFKRSEWLELSRET